MKRVLVVAYYFPPMGGAGTQRFAKFCRYLPEHDWQPVVLAAAPGAADRSAPHDDPSLQTGLAGLQVVRVAPRPGRHPVLWCRRRLRLFLDQDEWALDALPAARRLVQEQPPACVVTTLSPFASYRVGLDLQRRFGLPWVVDLRDPWALDGWRSYRTRLHARHDLAHMVRALRSADCVIANVPEAAREYIALGADPARVAVIPNGWDEEDFAAPAAARPADDRFRLVHLGTLHAADAPVGLTRNRALEFRWRQIEPLGRTGGVLLQALARLRQSDPAAAARIDLHLFGRVDESHRRLAEQLGVDQQLRLHGYVPHGRSVAELRAADAVFVPLHGVAPGERALVVPGKLYEALASERPVLAALPPGDGADLVRHLDAGVVVGPTDAEAIARALADLFRRWQQGRPATGCPRSSLRPFSRRTLTGLLGQVLAAVAARAGRVAVESPWTTVGVQPAVAAS